MSLFKPQFMKPWIEAYKKGGVKELLTQKGWKVIVAFSFFTSSEIHYCILSFLGLGLNISVLVFR